VVLAHVRDDLLGRQPDGQIEQPPIVLFRPRQPARYTADSPIAATLAAAAWPICTAASFTGTSTGSTLAPGKAAAISGNSTSTACSCW
jgi:hypothetical protein